jgi:hypothetical protein
MKSLIIGLAATAFAWSAAAQDARYATVLPHGRCMVVSMTPKTVKGTIVVPFGLTFKTAPIVTVSSDWIGGSAVTEAETVTAVDIDQFSETSNNAAGNFYVSWIAVGRAGAKACK